VVAGVADICATVNFLPTVIWFVVRLFHFFRSLTVTWNRVAISVRLSPGRTVYEVVFVVDGSPDRCFEILRQRLPQTPFRSRLILHSRNFGSFAAIRMGLEAGQGPFYAVLAADLQELHLFVGDPTGADGPIEVAENHPISAGRPKER